MYRHNLGVAENLTMVDLVSGIEVPIGTAFDTLTLGAHTANAEGRVQRDGSRGTGPEGRVQRYRQILVRAREIGGVGDGRALR